MYHSYHPSAKHSNSMTWTISISELLCAFLRRFSPSSNALLSNRFWNLMKYLYKPQSTSKIRQKTNLNCISGVMTLPFEPLQTVHNTSVNKSQNTRLKTKVTNTRGCWKVLSPNREETSYSDQTRNLFNILPTKLNTLLSPLLWLLQANQNKKNQKVVRPTRSPR